jgi:hypothetical protein
MEEKGVTLILVDGKVHAVLDDEPLPEGIKWGLHLDADIVANFGEEV